MPSGNLGFLRRRQGVRRPGLIALLLMNGGLGLSPHLLMFGLSSRGFSNHSFELSTLKVGFIGLRPLEDSAE